MKIAEYQKEYYEKNKDKFKINAKIYYEKNKEKIKKENKKYYEENKENVNTKAKKYYNDNKDKFLKYQKQYNIENKNKIKQYDKYWSKKNKQNVEKYQKIYYKINKDRILQQQKVISKKYRVKNKEKIRNYDRMKYNTDLNYRLKFVLSSRIRDALKNNSKSKHTKELLGCSVEYLKKHIENQFVEGMTWENHGLYGWHIDHIIPCCSFDLSDPKQQQECFHYTNLQPLWAKDNLKKGGLV